MNSTRTAFFVSDRTGITAEMLGHSLLTQFDGARIKGVTVPFIDSVEKAHAFASAPPPRQGHKKKKFGAETTARNSWSCASSQLLKGL